MDESTDKATDMLSLKLRLHLLEALVAGSTTSFDSVLSSEEKQYQHQQYPISPVATTQAATQATTAAATAGSSSSSSSPLAYSLVRRQGYCKDAVKDALDDPVYEPIRRFLEYCECAIESIFPYSS